MNKILVLITTESKINRAESISKLLIKRKLAACVSFKEINSTYSWENKVEQTKEIEIVIKSTPEKLDNLIKFLKFESSYKIPQIIYKIFNSDIHYHRWVQDSVM